MIYFDNAATSFPKPGIVFEEMESFLKNTCANPGRSGHSQAIKTDEQVMKVRELLAEFFNISDLVRICFTKNATEAINYGIQGVLSSGDHVITTSMEHNSVIRPLKELEYANKIELTIVKAKEFGEIDYSKIEKEIKANTKLIVSTISSNVNGTIIDVGKIGDISKKYSTIFLVDASQGAGSIEIDVQKMGIDILALPGHKSMMGPQGTGLLYVKKGLEVKPLIYGGTGTESDNLLQPSVFPDIFESGTLNTYGIVGLGAGIKYINTYSLDRIKEYKHTLIDMLFKESSVLNNIKIYSLNDINKNSGIFSFSFKDVSSKEVSFILNNVYDIGTRAGLHCAPLAHSTLGTSENGLVRVSVSIFNSHDEIRQLITALKEIDSEL